MPTITIEEPGCSEGLLTVGRLVVRQGVHAYYPTSTHWLEIDILPVPLLGPSTGLTFVGPTIEVEISPTVSGGVERWLVPMSHATRPNRQYLEYFDGGSWQAFLDNEVGIPSVVDRVRLRRDQDSIDWRGSAAAPNGLTYFFGLSMTGRVGVIDTVSFLVQASATQVEAESKSCLRRVSDLAVGAPWPGFVPRP